MHLEAQETAQLYNLLSIKLGTETTDTLFKYIDNKTERSVDASINTLAKKEGIELIRKEMADIKTELIKCMFLLWAGQITATFALAIWIWK